MPIIELDPLVIAFSGNLFDFEESPVKDRQEEKTHVIYLKPWQRRATIASPGYPNFYRENVNLSVKILAPEGFIIQVIFAKFDLEFEQRQV